MLEPAELEGVIGHELTHVINRDVMVMTIASFFATISALIIRFASSSSAAASAAAAAVAAANEEEAVES
jgi:Zn-dependent protease with chaperone function